MEEETTLLTSGSSSAKPYRRRPNQLLRGSLWLNLILSAILGIFTSSLLWQSTHCSLKPSVLGDGHNLTPMFTDEKVKFEPNSDFADLTMLENAEKFEAVLQQWSISMPKGRGFIRVPRQEREGLERPFLHPNASDIYGYSVASFHQVHCLYQILSGFGSLKFGRTLNHHSDHSNHMDRERHMVHCFDYLRQSSLCAGDMALEGHSEMARGMSDGWGYTHICKNRGERFKWIEEHRLADLDGI